MKDRATQAELVEVELRDGRHVVYTKEVLWLLMTDDYVLHIFDLQTDELLK